MLTNCVTFILLSGKNDLILNGTKRNILLFQYISQQIEEHNKTQ